MEKFKIDEFGRKIFSDENNKFHNESGPALIYKTGTKMWFKHGIQHREDGPAYERTDGYKAWYLNGKWLKTIKSQEEFERYLKLIAFQ